jgi:ABC-type Mn2+/Zn2+ transport system permease subunit
VLDALLDPFRPEFMQRALLEVVVVAAIGGLLGSWIVLRRLAFYSHAVGSATFPGLVLADAWSLAAQGPALGSGLAAAVLTDRLSGVRPRSPDAATGLVLVGFLATGVILASDVYGSGAGVDRLLFGSLLAVSERDVQITLAAAVALVALAAGCRRSWLAAGFDAGSARHLGVDSRRGDLLLLLAVAVATVVAVDAAGALLAAALFVLPAAAARLVTSRLATFQAAAVGLAVAQGVAGLWLAYELDVPPGPAIALLGGGVLAVAALAILVRERT